MRKHRRLTTAFLALALVIGWVVPGFAAVTVNTAVFSDLGGAKYANEMAELGTLGIYQGDGTGKGTPEDTLTRLQQIVVVVRALGKGKLADALASQPTGFKDDASIASWGKGYVNVGLAMGLLNPQGYGDGQFHPNDPVTHAQVIAMLVRALKADNFVKGAWPTNYLIAGEDLGISAGIELFAGIPANRGEMAKLVLNTINTRNRYDTNGNLVSTGTPLVQSSQSSCVVTGTITEVTDSTVKLGSDVDLDCSGSNETTAGTAISLADSVSLSGASALANLLNQNVRLLAKSNKITYAQVTSSAVVSGQFDKFVDKDAKTTDDTNEAVKIVLKDGSSHDLATHDTAPALDTSYSVYYNTGLYVVFDTGGDDDLTQFAAGDDVALTKNSDGKVTRIDATKVNYGNARLTTIDTVSDPDDISFTDQDNTSVGDAPLDSEVKITLGGNSAAIGDLKVNDIIKVTRKWGGAAFDGNVLSIDAVRDTVLGKVVSTREVSGTGSGKFVTLEVNGANVEYKVSSGNSTEVQPQTLPGTGVTYKYALNHAGELRRQLDIIASTTLVKVTSYTSSSGDDSVSVDEAGTAKTFTVKGGSETAVSAGVDLIGTLSIDGASGKADGFTAGVIKTGGAADQITWWAKKPGVTVQIAVGATVGNGVDTIADSNDVLITLKADGAKPSDIVTAISGTGHSAARLVGAATGSAPNVVAATTVAKTNIGLSGEVVTIDATNDIVTLKADASQSSSGYFVNAKTYYVYQNDASNDAAISAGSYIGHAGLAIGDKVIFHLDADGKASLIIRKKVQSS